MAQRYDKGPKLTEPVEDENETQTQEKTLVFILWIINNLEIKLSSPGNIITASLCTDILASSEQLTVHE